MTDARQVIRRYMSEEDLLVYATDLLTVGKWRWMHARRSDKALTMGHPGWPDIVAVRAGRLLVAELKRHGQVPTPSQWAWLGDLMEAKVETYVWGPADMERMKEVLA